ncbi:GAF domain-containing protein [Zoogloea sp.]|uniref:GAF domain-containing protein n=1 Tax=Zoogloea sp. TaxID=49181 RepID=UPI0035B36D51
MPACSPSASEAARLTALRATGLLDSPPDAAFDNLVELVRTVFDVPVAFVALMDAERQWFKAAAGTDIREVPRDASSFCARTIGGEGAFVVHDVLADSRFATEAPACAMPGVRFYAGMPLRPLDGQPIGTLCVIDTRPRVLGARELDCLARFARQAEELIRHHLASLASRRQQDSLELAVARNEALLNRAAVGIIRITSRGIIEQVNPFAEQILGYAAAELIGRNVRMIMPQRWAQHHDEYLDSYLKGRPPSVIGIGREVQALHKSGRTIPVHLAVSEVMIPGQDGVEFIGILSDLSELYSAREREQAQHRLLQVLHRGMTDFAALMSSDQLWSFLKDALCDLTGSDYALIGEVVPVEGKPGLKIHAITDLSWNDDSRRLMERLRSGDMMLTNPDSMLGRVFAGGEVMMTNDVATVTRRTGFPHGHPPLHNYLGVPIVDQGQVIGMFAIANSRQRVDADLLAWLEPFTATCALLINLYRRINEQARFTHELEIAHAQQARASRAKTEFLSSMSHELRTPMNSIIGFSQLLLNNRRQPLPERQAGQVEQILKSGQHLLTLINDILDLARIEAGRLAFSIEPVEIAGAIEESVASISALAEMRRIAIHLPPAGTGRPRVMADFTRIKQVLINFLSNAIKYNRDGGRIDIGWREDGEALRVEVRDTGVGIPAERIDELFQPFNRIGAEHSGIEGAGVGLALTKQLVEKMAGRVGVDSIHGSGSCFWFALQRATDLPVAAAAAAGVQPLAGDETHRQRVLYVEDNPANQRLMTDIFEDFGACELSCAHEAALGIELARAERPALILMDINLPGMDGYAALAALKADPATRDVPVVALSANAMPADVERGLAAGFADYLTKPLDFTRLYAVLAHHLGGEPDA